MYCTSCGAANALGASACGQCGAPASGGATAVVSAAQPARAAASWWALVGIAAVMLAALAPLLFSFPWRSLMDLSDGATLVGDAALGFLVGGAALVGGVLALRNAVPEEGRATPWVVAGVAAVLGLFAAVALSSEAYRLAHATITNGYVNGKENVFLATAILALLALAALGIAMIPPGDRRERFVVVSAAIGVVAGVALAAACAWTLLNATALQRAAAARVRNEAPNAALLLMVASFCVAAVLRKLRRA